MKLDSPIALRDVASRSRAFLATTTPPPASARPETVGAVVARINYDDHEPAGARLKSQSPIAARDVAARSRAFLATATPPPASTRPETVPAVVARIDHDNRGPVGARLKSEPPIAAGDVAARSRAFLATATPPPASARPETVGAVVAPIVREGAR
jgi:hypothetical protein